ncbi:MAG: hypothetical protein ABJZ55_01920 [Fuerstiella sp.]
MVASRFQEQDSEQNINLNLKFELPESLSKVLIMLLSQATIAPAQAESTVETTSTDFVSNSTPPAPVAENPPTAPVQEELQHPQFSSLLDLYCEHLEERDQLKGVKRTSIQETKTGLRKFDSWASSHSDNTRTASPGVAKTLGFSILDLIASDPLIMRKFVHWVMVDDGKSVDTARKSVVATFKVLNWLTDEGKYTGRKPEKPSTAEMQKLTGAGTNDGLAETVTLPEMLAIRAATHIATWPELGNLPPSAYWDFAIDVCWTFGPRSQDWFSCDAEKSGLLWEDVCFDSKCPAPQMKGFEHPHGWLWINIGKSGTRRILLPMSSRIRFHIDQWRGVDPDRVVPLNTGNQSHGKQWRKLLKAAKVDSRIRLSLGQGNPSLRKAASDYWEDIGDDVANYVAGRTVKSVKGKNYSRLPRRVAKHIEGVPFDLESQG